MDRADIVVGNVVTLDDGRNVVITKVHDDYSFEWDIATPKREEPEQDQEKEVDEKEEDIKIETKKKAPEKAKTKRPIKK